MAHRGRGNTLERIFGLKVLSTLVKGAEAEIYLVDFYGQKAVLKYRKPKPYRDKVLDLKIRSERTVLEAKLTAKASLLGVNTPAIYAVSRTNTSILMEYVEGTTLLTLDNDSFLAHLAQVAHALATLHKNGIIHGDPTPSNMILSNGNVFLLDFGLGNFSYDVEERAVDVNLFLKICEALKQPIYQQVVTLFRKSYVETLGEKQGESVFERVKEIRLRGRYVLERREKS